MSHCSCIMLVNGVSDAIGFNHPRKNCVVVKNVGQNPVELCESGHRLNPNTTWLIPKESYEAAPMSSDSKIKVLARFGAKQQLLKS